MKRIFPTLALLVVLVSLLAPMRALAFDPFGKVCDPSNASTQNSSLCQGQPADPTKNPLTGPDGLLRHIANLIALAAGFIAVIIIIVSGLKYVTSGGDPAKAKSAKDAIVGALIGLAIIALADSIISFVISRV